jgi:hypothetical protein
MPRLRLTIISACIAAAAAGAGVALSVADAHDGANDAAAQYTPSDLRGSFPELPPKRSTPQAPRRGPSMRFAAMDLAASGG